MLHKLIEANLNTSTDDVHCGICKKRTRQNLSWFFSPDILLLEILRGEERSKLFTADVSFDPSKVKIRKSVYQVIATAHHSGGISSGHWITKIKLKDNSWWLLDSLKTFAQKTISPRLQPDKGSLVSTLMKSK